MARHTQFARPSISSHIQPSHLDVSDTNASSRTTLHGNEVGRRTLTEVPDAGGVNGAGNWEVASGSRVTRFVAR